jgi:outer membrane protein assembly factor BamB
MRKVIAIAAAVSCGQMLAGAERGPAPSARVHQGTVASNLIDYTTDGADIERSGWVKDEKILTRQNVGTLKLKWKLETGNQPRALHALMPVLVIGQLNTPGGVKQVGIVNGISDNLYGFDVETGKILWQKHWDYPAPAGRGGAPPPDPKKLGFLQPGGSSDTPVIGPADAQGRRPVYFVTGDGMLHIINAADGTDLQPPYKFYGGKGWALNLVGNTLWMQTTYGGASIAAVRVDDPEHKVMTWNAGSGGAWGRRGVAVDSTGTAWTTTGDGVYDLASDPPRYANSVVGVHIQNGQMKLKDYYTPTNWEWLRKRDLDPNNTPTVFKYKGRELVAASGKECRLYLIDPESAGGENHQTPAFKTPLFCNEEVDFQDMGSWGALSSWEDRGTRWVLAPFWGPVHSQAKFPLSYGPVKEGGVAAFKLVERAGKLEFAPAWVSRDMKRGEPVLIVNGMVVGYGSGEETRQAWPDIGLQFDSSIRAAKGTRAVIYVLDAITGKELWSSGDTMHQFNHFSGVTVANGRIYLGTYDGTLYCFGVDAAAPGGK